MWSCRLLLGTNEAAEVEASDTKFGSELAWMDVDTMAHSHYLLMQVCSKQEGMTRSYLDAPSFGVPIRYFLLTLNRSFQEKRQQSTFFALTLISFVAP